MCHMLTVSSCRLQAWNQRVFCAANSCRCNASHQWPDYESGCETAGWLSRAFSISAFTFQHCVGFWCVCFNTQRLLECNKLYWCTELWIHGCMAVSISACHTATEAAGGCMCVCLGHGAPSAYMPRGLKMQMATNGGRVGVCAARLRSFQVNA